MSLQSMTGHGRGAASGRGWKAEVELSTTNRKQLDVRLTIPRSVAALEARVVQRVQAALSRGQVAGSVHLHASEQARARGVAVDRALATGCVRELRRTGRRLGLKDDLSLSALAAFPDMIQYRYLPEDADAVWPVVRQALDRALAALVRMRQAEGEALARDLEGRLLGLGRSVEAVARRAPRVVRDHRRALLQRIRQAGVPALAREDALQKEIVLFAERCDISEELTRLRSHIRQALGLCRSAKPAGRTLDFLVQEMFREINTVGSKANDLGIARRVVEFKSELEKIREQVQNVE